MNQTTESNASQDRVHAPGPQSATEPEIAKARPDTVPRAIMVLGMHRSGTSALTRVISLLGADLPKNLMRANSDNAAGYWESDDLAVIHEELLASNGSHWHDWRAFNPDWYVSADATVFKQRVLDALRCDYPDEQLFVIKDPRISRFWPFWRDVLSAFGAEPALVIPVRNPLEVMASLRQRDGFVPAKSGLLWLRHVLDAEQTTRGLPRAVVTFDALLSDWQGVAATLGARLGLDWPRRTPLTDHAIDQFLAVGFRHHAIAADQLAATPDVADWIKQAYAALVQLSMTPEHLASMAQLDRIRDEFERASFAFGTLLAASEAELALRNDENAQVRAENGILQKHISDLLDEQQRQTEAAKTAAALLAAEQQRAAAQADRLIELEAIQRTVQGLNKATAEGATKIAELLTALTTAASRVASLETSLESAMTQLQDAASRRLMNRLRHAVIRLRTRSSRRLIVWSGLFDPDWYRVKYPKTRLSGLPPLLDYLRSGAAEGRDPHPLFDGAWYLRQYPDVGAADANPFVHYLRQGAAEGRNPSPLFDSNWYLQQYPDVRTSGLNPLAHYVHYGADEGRDPSPVFDSDWYLDENPDVRASGLNPLTHYREHGLAEGRRPSAFAGDSGSARSTAGPVGWQPPVSDERNFVPETQVDRYAAWMACNEPDERSIGMLRTALATRRGQLPRISVIMPVFNTPPTLLDQAIASVLGQIYDDWELCIADDASTDPAVAESLTRWKARDARIRITYRDCNGGITAATNSAAAIANGEFLAFLDHDDLLSPDALGEIALHAAEHPETDLIYSDDDKIDMNDRRFAPQFKPAWSPVLLLSYMYMSHLLVVRRGLFVALGGGRLGFDGSQDYDLALRAAERARQVGHIPRVLYHWRAAPNSIATSADTKPHSFSTGLQAVTDAFARRGLDAVVHHPSWAKTAKVGIFAADFPDDGPRVSILISTRNRLDLLTTCLDSIAKTTYRNYEVVIVDNESDDPATLDFLSNCDRRVLRVACPGGTFSFARINNAAVQQVASDFVLFLNNDTEVVNPRWLSQMMGYARIPGVGAVGAKLTYRDGTIQHAGIVLGYHNGLAGHAFKNVPPNAPGYLHYLRVARDCSGVTAACMLTPRALFLELGGLDEAAFAVAYNDVDYCCRLSDRGYHSVVCPDATLLHDEGKSRGFTDNPDEVATLRQRYGQRVDPYHNPNLSFDNERFEIRPYRHPRANGVTRIIAVTHNLNREGAPYAQFEIIRGLKRRDLLDPVILSPRDGPLRAAYEQAGIPVKIIVPPSIGGEAAFSRSIAALGQEFRALAPDALYANTLQTFWAIAAAETVRIPTLLNVHESEPWQTYFDFLRPELRPHAYRCFATPYRVVFGSHATRRAWEVLNSRHNFTTIHNGIDLDHIHERIVRHDRNAARNALGIANTELVVTLLGTVCERKGQLDLVKSLRLLRDDLGQNLRVFIVGDHRSHYSDQLHAEVASLPATGTIHVQIVPETREPYTFLQASDIAVCCSRSECYPRVIMEKMHFGLPLITTPVFGIAEQVQANVNGLFYQPGDVAQLAAHLVKLATDIELRTRLGANGPRVLRSLPSIADTLSGFDHLFREARLSYVG